MRATDRILGIPLKSRTEDNGCGTKTQEECFQEGGVHSARSFEKINGSTWKKLRQAGEPGGAGAPGFQMALMVCLGPSSIFGGTGPSRSLRRGREGGEEAHSPLQKTVPPHPTACTSPIPGGSPGGPELYVEGQKPSTDNCETVKQVAGAQLVGAEGVSRGPWMRISKDTLLSGPAECLGAEGRLAHKLFRDLFANYTSALRPVADTDQALNVTLEVTLSQIIDMVRRDGHTAAVCAAARVRAWGLRD